MTLDYFFASPQQQKKKRTDSKSVVYISIIGLLVFALIIVSIVLTAPSSAVCDPDKVVLNESKQWEYEEGYWVGEYSFYGPDGKESVSNTWNYPYDHYRGFITGSTKGNAYRQRNVFMYPPQKAAKCEIDNTVDGAGVCGTNGNTKIFEADQKASVCSLNPELKGDIEGPYGPVGPNGPSAYTYTELIGKDNSLLYQVYAKKGFMGIPEDRIMQSQLTTLTTLSDGTVRRTRTAQGFDAFGNVGAPTYASYYRERKVSKEEFWQVFNDTQTEYNILDSDLCDGPGFASCQQHLEESFEL